MIHCQETTARWGWVERREMQDAGGKTQQAGRLASVEETFALADSQDSEVSSTTLKRGCHSLLACRVHLVGQRARGGQPRRRESCHTKPSLAVGCVDLGLV